MSNKKRLVNYTSRDFNSIKADLEEHARRYYPDSFRDFSENSFGSFMIDTVSYVGDMLSFYLDYQVNESFLDTAVEYANVRKLASSEGYSGAVVPPVTALVDFYVLVPAATTGLGPDSTYIPIMKKGALLSSESVSFLLHDDVDFSSPTNEIVASKFSDATGKPTEYAIRAQGIVVSSNQKSTSVRVGEFERFKRIRVGPASISGIVSIMDSEGNEYYEVKHLAQDVIYVDTTNSNARQDGVPSILKRKIVPRRFVVTREAGGLYIQFGSNSEEEIETRSITEPQQVALKLTGKPYISDTAFDPSELLGTKSMGVSPSNTILSIVYEESTATEVSIAPGELNALVEYELSFPNLTQASSQEVQNIIYQSVEISNDTQISEDLTPMSSQEIKTAALSAKFTQMRAVTRQDYEALCYLMPRRFGSIKRATIINDPSATNRRLSLYVVSADANGNLQITNNVIKDNLRTWLQSNKMMNDLLDIYDARIVNFGFDFKVMVDPTQDKIEVLARAMNRLKRDYAEKMHIGEPFYLTSVFNSLNKVDGIIDTLEVKPKLLTGTGYNTAPISIEQLKSADGTYLLPARNMVLEIKDFDTDIGGVAL
jgi:hypothetical protein